jgi:hypothetical protein
MPLRRKQKSRTHAPATVLFTEAVNEHGKKQLAVYAQCQYAGNVAGPVWSHTRASVGRCLATLTKLCECGRPFHKHRESEGRRVLPDERD